MSPGTRSELKCHSLVKSGSVYQPAMGRVAAGLPNVQLLHILVIAGIEYDALFVSNVTVQRQCSL